ncbi:MAG: hypothetical protein MUE51_03790 [Thermoleophilia bacterium]|nr:hypothetical protein [Thermoleophilia bacterium]
MTGIPRVARWGLAVLLLGAAVGEAIVGAWLFAALFLATALLVAVSGLGPDRPGRAAADRVLTVAAAVLLLAAAVLALAG